MRFIRNKVRAVPDARAGRLLVVLVVAASVASCGDGDGPADAGGPVDAAAEAQVRAMATVAPLADLVARVLGERGTVRTVVPHGADSHTFEPAPGLARALAEADVLFGNGLGLNVAVLRLAEATLPRGAPLVLLGEEAVGEAERVRVHRHDDDGHAHPHAHDDDGHAHDDDGDGAASNPHAWMDPILAQRYVEAISGALSELDPHGAGAYRQNAAAEIARMGRLHESIVQAVATIPERNRTLVTFHDSWAYFAERYGFELVAVVQPPDLSEPSARGVRQAMDTIGAAGVPAVFGSEVFPSDVLAVIAEETGARYVGDLTDDVLPGSPGDPEHSYIGMMAANARLIVEALGGDPASLDGVRWAPS